MADSLPVVRHEPISAGLVLVSEREGKHDLYLLSMPR